jgi:hypothetical protein
MPLTVFITLTLLMGDYSSVGAEIAKESFMRQDG